VTTIDLGIAALPEAAPDKKTQAELAEQRFLQGVRDRVAWQAERAAALRAVGAPAALDLRDLAQLWALVASRPEDPRSLEWRAFLVELRELTDESGHLPEELERLVRVVLSDLL
jgi:hypothetical protein